MKRNRLMLLLAALMAAMLVMSACGKKTSPGEALRNAWAASMEMKSFTFDGTFAIDGLEMPPGALNETAQPYLSMLQNASVAVSGAYDRDSKHAEIILKPVIGGDLAVSIEVPIIWADGKTYVRIPTIPLLPLGDAAGRFVVIEPAGEGAALPAIDVDLYRKFFGEIMGIVFRHLDGDAYFREAKKGDIPGLPDDLKADRFVVFSITQDNADAFMTALAERILPEIIDLLIGSEAYRSMLQLTEEELKRAKEELAATDSESLRGKLDELRQNLKVHEISMTGAIKGGNLVYQKLKVSVEQAENGGEPGKIGFSFDIRYDNINQDVTFEHDIPAETLTMEEFWQSLFAGMAF